MANHVFITGQFVRIGQKLANVGDRIFAIIIDMIFLFIILSIVSTITSMFYIMNNYEFSIIFLFVVIGVILLYPLLMEWLFKGQTLGKMVMGIRVVGSDGSTPSLASLSFRWVLFLVEGFSGFGLIVILFTKDNQRLGDLAGDTYVVKTRIPYFFGTYKRESFPPDFKPFFPQVARLSQAQINLITSTYYLMGEDGEKIRIELCKKICGYLKINVTGWPPQQFLRQLCYDFNFLTATTDV